MYAATHQTWLNGGIYAKAQRQGHGLHHDENIVFHLLSKVIDFLFTLACSLRVVFQ